MPRIALLSLLLAVTPVWGGAQSVYGTLVGTVTDPSGAVVPGVTIRVVNLETGIEAPEYLTNGEGNYTVPNLTAGTYRLEVTFDGFRTEQREFDVEVDGQIRQNVGLTIGAATEINVSQSPPVVQTDQASIGIVIRPRQILGMPNNGGLFESLAQLSPGVVTPAEGSELGTRGGFNSAGMDENTNLFLLDGFDNGDPVVRNLLFRPPLEMIREFSIVQNAYPAEYGRSAGTVVNVVTRGGTNAWHGSLSNDLRNDNLDAVNYFASTTLPEPNLIRNQFSGTLGGPIVPNQTFLFAAYEGLREKRGEVRRATVPTLDMRTGDFSVLLPAIQLMDPSTNLTTPFAGNIIPPGDQDEIGAAVLAAYPEPNTAGSGPFGLSGNRIEVANHIENVDTVSGRIDHRMGDTQVMGRYSFSDGRTDDPFRSDTPGGSAVLLSGFGQTNDIARTSIGLDFLTTLGPTMIHDFRIGFGRLRQEQIPQAALPPEQESIAGFLENYLSFNPVHASQVGSGTWFSRVANVFNYVDQLSWLRGNHYFKTGVDIRRYQFNGGSSPVSTFIFAGFSTGTPTPGAPFGIAPGYGVADLLLGRPLQTASFEGNPDGHSRKTEIAAYFQDDWKVTPSLTLNWGLRWEWYGRITETEDRQSTWSAGCNCILVAGTDLPRQLVEDDWNNFAPRFGFAWRPFDTMDTVVRGGGGIYYDSEQRHNFFQIANPPFFVSERYQVPLGLTLDNPFPGGAALAPNALELDYRDTYYEHWSLSVQQLVAPETVLEVAYLGSHGVKLQRARDANFFIPGVSTPPFAGFGPIRLFEQAANSIYHSLQTRIERRFLDRLSFIASHTWGHSIDDRPAEALASLRSFQDHNNPGADRGDSDFDVRHRFTTGFLYDLPVTGFDGAAGQLLDGWALNGLVRLQTGRPFTPYLGGTALHPDVVSGADPVPADQGPDNWIDASAFAPPAGPLGTARRNSLRGPGLQVVDLAAVKHFATGEDNDLEFRVELFNAFNHPNFSLPDPVFGSPSFGTIASTITPAREIQVGLRYGF